jgi:hypothetical protein
MMLPKWTSPQNPQYGPNKIHQFVPLRSVSLYIALEVSLGRFLFTSGDKYKGVYPE